MAITLYKEILYLTIIISGFFNALGQVLLKQGLIIEPENYLEKFLTKTNG
jgi:hypothetical protein